AFEMVSPSSRFSERLYRQTEGGKFLPPHFVWLDRKTPSQGKEIGTHPPKPTTLPTSPKISFLPRIKIPLFLLERLTQPTI
ncbi:MAG: hypothetical protein ACI3YH_01130, partial [Eubacteriales bacterium]